MTKKKLLLNISAGMFALAAPFAMMAALPTASTSYSKAALDDHYQQEVTITNGDFNFSTSSAYTSNDFSGWKRKWGDGRATTMALDVSYKYSEYGSSIYYLKENPGKIGTDNKILMINSAKSSPNSSNFESKETSEGYYSNTLSLSANSYYEFQVSMRTASFDSAIEFGSIYISGLEDENENSISLCYENLTTRNWETYYFYIATGEDSQSITIDLWLGNRDNASHGVVFFDEVKGVQLSENAYYKNINYRTTNGDNYKTASIGGKNIVDTSDLNFDFEADTTSSSLVGWEIENSNSEGHASIVNMNEGYFKDVTDFAYPGTDYSKDNTKSLALWANKGYVDVVSKPIDIKAFGLYKITLRAKTSELSGSFNYSVRETSKIKNDFAYLSSHDLDSASSTAITSVGSDKFINQYNEMTFYVQGHNRYDSQIELLLSLGSEESLATGAVVIDNIVVEKVSSEDFKTDGNYLQLKVGTAAEDSLNGNFNNATDIDKNQTGPVKPANWTLSQSDSIITKRAGIINTYAPYFNAAGYDFANPGCSSDSTTSDVENIFMMYNASADYQSATSSSFSISAGSYNDITFKYKTLSEGASINVKIVDEDGIVLKYDKLISSDTWTDYTCTINAGEAANSLKLIIELGSESTPVAGYAFIDRVKLNSSSEETFASSDCKIDLSGFMLSLDPENSISNAISPSNAFTGKVTNGTLSSSEGGIIKGEGNTNFEYVNADGEICSIDDGSLTNNVLVISTHTASTYTLTSNFKLTTEGSTDSESYYELTFRLLTCFPSAKNAKEDAKYGVKIGLDGFDLIEELKSNDGWQEYTILFKSSEAKDAQFTFALVSDELNTTGCAYLTDIAWKTSDKTAYTDASEDEKFGGTLFTSQTSNAEAEDDSSSDDESSDNSSSSSSSSNSNWLLIPSLITAVAVIIAVIGFSLRNVKFKKIDKKRKETYDRSSTASDLIANQAKDVQKAEIEKVEKQIADIQSQIEELETLNKEVSAKAREAGKVTAEVEKEFKSFASKRGKLQKQIEELGEHKAMLASPEHLLSIEKKIVNLNKNKAKSSAKKDSKPSAKK